MSSPQSNINLPVLLKEIWSKIIEVCELDSLYPMYLVNKLFQQIIEDMKLLPPLCICSLRDLDMCEDSWENLESYTKDLLSHHKVLQEIKHYKLGFLTYAEPQELFNNSQLNSMINMLEIEYILSSRYDCW
jgi:hypothetical protein